MRDDFINLSFPDCCRKTFRDMHEAKDSWDKLRPFLGFGVFVTILSEPPPFSVFSVTHTDWEVLAESVKHLSRTERHLLAKIASLHFVHHQLTDPSGDLVRFWKNPYKTLDQ